MNNRAEQKKIFHETQLLTRAGHYCADGKTYSFSEERARAQEEDLCRKSTLYASLTSEVEAPFYQRHRDSYTTLASHAVLLSPCVTIFRDAENELSAQPVTAAVLTCAALVAHTPQ